MTKQLGRIFGGATFIVATAALVMCLSIHHARAELQGRLGELGPALDELAGEPGEEGDAQVLSLNGMRIEIRSETIATNVPTALRAAVERCGGEPDSLLSTELAAWDDESGFVGCFPSLRGLGPEELIAAADALLGRRDARGLGAFVYTYAHRTTGGTHLVEATLPELDLGSMFPARGDAPGADVEGVPRPAAARRILSVAAPDRPYQVVVYAVDGADPAAVAAAYHDQLEAAGWELRHVDSDDARRVAYGFLGDTVAAIVIRPDRGGTTVTVGLVL